MNKKVFITSSILIIVLEIILCFVGPMALMTTPSLMVTPIYNVGGSDEEVDRTFNRVEQIIAKTGSFNVLSKKRLTDYFINKGEGDLEFSYEKTLNYKEYLEIGRKMEIERLLLSILTVGRNSAELTSIIRDVESGDIINRTTFKSDSLDNLLKGIGVNGEELKMVEALSIGTNGICLYDNLVFFLVLCQITFTILYIFKRHKRGYSEFIISLSFLMFLFAFIYALNANMSYIQLFIAQMGEIGMAESTEMEQLFAFIRFMPFIIINLVLYIKEGFKSGLKSDIREKIKTWALPLIFISALMFSLSFPSFLSLDGWGILAWIALIPLFYILQIVPKRMGVFYGLIFGALQSILINYWHGTFKLIAMPFSTVTTVLLYTPFMIAMVFLLRLNKRFNFLIIPFFWVIFDYLRSIGFTGYPWGLIGTSQYKFIWFNQLAAVTGVWGLSFIILLFNSSVTHLLLNFKKSGKYQPITLFSVIFTLNVLGGAIYTAILDSEEPIDRVKISLIQQNSDPRRHDFYKTYDSLINLTDSSIEEWGETPDLVVWSEGAFKRDIRLFSRAENLHAAKSNGVADLKEYIKEKGIWLLTGTQDHEKDIDENGKEIRKNYNSSILLNSEGGIEDVYHKIHLVPFSEHFPYKEQFPFIASLLERFNTSNWTMGERRFSFQLEKFGFSTPICFEDVFPSELREFVESGTDIFVNISNDYWAMTPVEAKQHGINALLRTVENRRAMVRSTCSGYTVYFDRVGRIAGEADGYYTESYLNALVPIYKKSYTIYNKLGDWFPLFSALLITIIAVFTLFRRKRE